MRNLWIGFVVFVCFLLWLDLAVLHKRGGPMRARTALMWTGGWVALALAFGGLVYYLYDAGLTNSTLSGAEAAMMYVAGYLVEQSLSLDNVFVFALVFSYFRVPEDSQHRTLFYGILGAMVLRALMILGGTALLARFEWLIYVFGALLVFTALRLSQAGQHQVDPERNPLVRLARRLYPVTADYHGERFFVRLADGRLAMTPLFLVLLVIEASDVLFAVDSIPAIFGITRDPFLVYTSNMFAILGLRSLYFVLAHALRRFAYVQTSLVFVLAFIGLKMLLASVLHVPTAVSLLVVGLLLGGGVLASLVKGPRHAAPDDPTLPGTTEADAPAGDD